MGDAHLGREFGDAAILEEDLLDEVAHPFGQGVDRGPHECGALAVDDRVLGARDLCGDGVGDVLVERGGHGAGVVEGGPGGGVVDAERVGEFPDFGGAAEREGQGLLHREGLLDAGAHRAGRPVGAAHLVGDRAGDAATGVGAERHPALGVVGVGGHHEAERRGRGEVVARQVRRPAPDLGDEIADERQVVDDQLVARSPAHGSPPSRGGCRGSGDLIRVGSPASDIIHSQHPGGPPAGPPELEVRHPKRSRVVYPRATPHLERAPCGGSARGTAGYRPCALRFGQGCR